MVARLVLQRDAAHVEQRRCGQALPRQAVEVDVAAGQDDADALAARRRACLRASQRAAPRSTARRRASSAPTSCASPRRCRARVQVPMAATWARSARSVRADSAPRRPSAIVVRMRHRLQRARREAARRVVGARRLRAEHRDARPHAPRGDRGAGQQPAAADRRDDDVEVGHRVEQLERRRPLPRDDARSRRTDGRAWRPSRVATSAHVASRAASVGAQKCTCAPKPCTFASLIFGAFSGITTCAGMPRRRAAYASAAP